MHTSSIEILESRISPAALTGNILTYKDLDGDAVKITLSGAASAAAAANFTFNDAAAFTNDDPVQLRKIDLAMDQGFTGLNVTMTVTKVKGGDGFANVGLIDGTMVDLGTVTIKGDLGGINAGKNTSGPTALVALNVASMGRYGLFTQGGTGFLESDIDGPVGALNVTGDLVHEFFVLTNMNAADSTIGSVKIGGSLIGGPDTGAGSISANGNIGPVTIGKNLIGGKGVGSGQITTKGTIGNVTLGGSLLAGPTGNGGSIFGQLGIGDVSIAKDVRGGDQAASGFVRSQFGAIGKVTVGGSILGGQGNDSGEFLSALGMGAVTVGKSIVGSGGAGSGAVNSGGTLPGVTVGGSILGGVGQNSGTVTSGGDMGAVKIGGDIVGGNVGKESGAVFSAGKITSLTLAGSLIGGAAESSGGFGCNLDLGPVKIGGDILGGTGKFSGEIFTLTNGNITSVSVGGSIIAAAGGIETASGIYAQGTLGKVTVKGSLLGTAESPLYITGLGHAAIPPGATKNFAITSLSVTGSVEHTNILGGFDVFITPMFGNVEIGAVKVGGNWVASNLSAGVQNLGADGAAGGTGADADNVNFGDTHDVAIPGGTSTIASVAIKGLLLGTGTNTTDHFGIIARQVLSFKYSGITVDLPSATTSMIDLSPSTANDVTIREL